MKVKKILKKVIAASMSLDIIVESTGQMQVLLMQA